MLERAAAVLVVIDFQDSLLTKIPAAQSIVSQTVRLIRFAKQLEVPIVWTEQYPKKLGPTCAEIAVELEGFSPIAKTAFGCMGDSTFVAALEATGRRHLLITGVESHVCVLQTALGAVDRGFGVWAASDAIAAREQCQHKAALARMAQGPCQVVTAEMAMFEVLERADTPEFKQCLPLLKS